MTFTPCCNRSGSRVGSPTPGRVVVYFGYLVPFCTYGLLKSPLALVLEMAAFATLLWRTWSTKVVYGMLTCGCCPVPLVGMSEA